MKKHWSRNITEKLQIEQHEYH